MPDMTDHITSEDRAMGHARVEFAEMLFAEAPDVNAAPQPASELTAQVQASAMLAVYYEMRHGNDLRAAHIRALEAHRLALAEYAGQAPALISAAPGGEPELPPARDPID